MNGFERRLLSFLFAILFCSLWSGCNGSPANMNNLPPPFPTSTPDAGGGAGGVGSGAGPRPGPTPGTTASGKDFCVIADTSTGLQVCTFLLEGYEEANYNYHKAQALETYVNRVAAYIEETEIASECHLVSVTARGFADSQTLNKELPWSDVPEYCRASCRKDGAASANLTNAQLACVRQCMVANQIYSLLRHDVEIFPVPLDEWDKWKPEYRAYTGDSEVGDAYRKVEIILERGGQCPDD